MIEIAASLESIVPFMFVERFFVFALGTSMFAHFLCMASAAPVKSANVIMLFMMSIAFSAIGMMATSILGDITSMRNLLISGLGSMLLFWLWLWYEGMHVKDFLDKKYQ